MERYLTLTLLDPQCDRNPVRRGMSLDGGRPGSHDVDASPSSGRTATAMARKTGLKGMTGAERHLVEQRCFPNPGRSEWDATCGVSDYVSGHALKVLMENRISTSSGLLIVRGGEGAAGPLETDAGE
jgi:hypothetical protein